MHGLKSTIAMAVVLAGLGGYIYFVEWKKPEGGIETKEKALTGIDAEKIEELQIKSANGETARVVKGTSGWEIVEPAKADADASELSSVTTNLGSLEIQSVVDENPTDLAQYGLNPPRVDVGYRLKGEKDFKHVLIGEKTPTGGDLYAKLQNDKKVFLVSSFLDNTFNRTPFDLRDKRILSFEREKVDSLDLAAAGNEMQFVRSGGDWKIVKPLAARGDFGSIEGLVTRLNSAQMQRIVEPNATDLKKYGLDKPTLIATIKTGSAQASLMFGSTEGGSVYAKDASRPMIFAVEESLATDLKKNIGDFRRKDMFDFRSFNATRVEISRGPESYVFEKTKDKDGKEVWKDAKGQTADTTKVEDLLTKLSNVRAQSFEPTVNPALKIPEVVVTATFDGKTESLRFSKTGNDVFGARGDEPGSAKVEATAYEDALKALDAMR